MATDDYKLLLDPWLRDNPALMAIWEAGVVAVGPENALEWVQNSDEYDIVFPGNKRADGSLRLTEDQYFSNMEAYAQSLAAVGVNPDSGNFQQMFIDLILGDVSPNEFWEERVQPAHDRVMDRGDDAMARYAQDWGLDMSREALIASLLDPAMEEKILSKQIGISEIRLEFDRAFSTQYTNQYADLTSELYDRGFGIDQIQRLAQQGSSLVPTLDILAKRHNDPDDDFDLEEFTQATLYNDPDEARRMRRLMRQERSQFSGGRSRFTTSQQGEVTGLVSS